MVRKQVSKQKRREQRMRFKKNLILSVILIILMYVAVILASRMPRMQITALQIDGLRAVPADEVEARIQEILDRKVLLFIGRRTNLLLPRQQLSEGLMQDFPRIASVSLEVEDREVFFTFTERLPQHVACFGVESKRCWYMDERGVMFDRSPVYSSGVYIEYRLEKEPRSLPHSAFEADGFMRTTEFVEDLSKFKMSLMGVQHVGRDLRLYVDELLGYAVPEDSYLVFDYDEAVDPDRRADLLQRLEVTFSRTPFVERMLEKSSDFEYLDMRFKDKLFFKFSEPEDI